MFGFSTIGLGSTPVQEELSFAPQRPGLSDTDDRGIVSKKPPGGRSPESWLCEILNCCRWGRLESSFGRPPVSLFRERSTISRLVMLAIVSGIAPVRLLCERSLQEIVVEYTSENKKA